MPYGNRPIYIAYYGTQSQTKNANDLNQGDVYFLELLGSPGEAYSYLTSQN